MKLERLKKDKKKRGEMEGWTHTRQPRLHMSIFSFHELLLSVGERILSGARKGSGVSGRGAVISPDLKAMTVL